MTRDVKRDSLGLEIGPGCTPIAPKKQGFHMHVLDHCDKEALVEKYRPHGINVDNIEEVDFIWEVVLMSNSSVGAAPTIGSSGRTPSNTPPTWSGFSTIAIRS